MEFAGKQVNICLKIIKIKIFFLEEIFLVQCPGNKRDRVTLEAIIIEHVAPGTTIYTDGWAAYRHLDTVGFNWDSVNHSGKQSLTLEQTSLLFILGLVAEEFVKAGNPTVHTQRIESTWFRVKRWLPSSGR